MPDDMTDELAEALYSFGYGINTADDVINECADVANFVMMLADNMRAQSAKEDGT